MDLLTYIKNMPRRQALADALDTDPAYLWQLATRWRGRKPSHSLALRIEQATEKLGPAKVPKESLRPDVWPTPKRKRAA